jgi:hypothetical protein
MNLMDSLLAPRSARMGLKFRRKHLVLLARMAPMGPMWSSMSLNTPLVMHPPPVPAMNGNPGLEILKVGGGRSGDGEAVGVGGSPLDAGNAGPPGLPIGTTLGALDKFTFNPLPPNP